MIVVYNGDCQKRSALSEIARQCIAELSTGEASGGEFRRNGIVEEPGGTLESRQPNHLWKDL